MQLWSLNLEPYILIKIPFWLRPEVNLIIVLKSKMCSLIRDNLKLFVFEEYISLIELRLQVKGFFLDWQRIFNLISKLDFDRRVIYDDDVSFAPVIMLDEEEDHVIRRYRHAKI